MALEHDWDFCGLAATGCYTRLGDAVSLQRIAKDVWMGSVQVAIYARPEMADPDPKTGRGAIAIERFGFSFGPFADPSKWQEAAYEAFKARGNGAPISDANCARIVDEKGNVVAKDC